MAQACLLPRGVMSADGRSEAAMTQDETIAQYFSFLLERGFSFERDYSKGTDSTCTQIYRFRKDGANYLEYRVLSEKERNLLVCVRGEKRFPSPEKRYAGFVSKWKFRRLFSAGKRDVWLLAADLCRHELEQTGTVFGIQV